ncbi:MAG: HTH domain-containing protein [Candidatus Methylomirabilales bacterium]
MKRQGAGRMRQLIRCHGLLDCLSSRRIGYNASQLAEEFGCTTKTVYRDLRALREAGVQVWYNPRSRRYRLVKNRLVEGYLGQVGDDLANGDNGVGDLRIGLREAGRYLGISLKFLKELLRLEEIPVVRRGGRVQLRLEDLVRYKRRRDREMWQPRGKFDDGRPYAQGVSRTGLSLPLAG